MTSNHQTASSAPVNLEINTDFDNTSKSNNFVQDMNAALPNLSEQPTMIPPAVAATGSFPAPPSASLYVGELNVEVNEAILFDLFNQVGPVSSVRVCRDAITRRSLGYAYVNFHNVMDGERALDALNYHPIKGRPCRIMWCQRDPSVRRSGAGNIFIKNLDKSIDNKALHDTFSAFGNILSCKVVCDEHGSKGYGFVHFETAEAADSAIAKVNGMLLNDKEVYVGHHIPRRERASKYEETKAKFTNVYVKNFDESVNDEALTKMFAPFGEITSAVVQRDPTTDVSRGFGFVNFVDFESAQKAVSEMHGKEMSADKTLIVCRAQPKQEREEELRRQHDAARIERLTKFQGANLYVKNLEESVNEELLRAEFGAFGTIVNCKVMRDEKSGVSKGFAFVCFSEPEEAAKALADTNGKMLKEKPLYVAMAQRKEDRHALLQAQYHQRLQYRMLAQQGAAAAAQGIMLGNGRQFPNQSGAPGNEQMAPGMFPGGGPRRMQHQGYPPMMPQQRQQMPSSGMDAGMAAAGPSNGAMMMQMPQQHMFSQAPAMRYGNNGGGRGGFRGGRGGFQQQMHQQGGNNMAGFMRNSSFSNNPDMSSMMLSQGGNPAQIFPLSRRPNFPSMGANGGFSRGGGPGMRRNFPAPMDQQQNMQSGFELTASYLASLPLELQKQTLGERLYSLISQREPAHAQKVTGMLLEMDNGEILHLLESPETLASKITEAVSTFESTVASSSA